MKKTRVFKIAKELNISSEAIISFLKDKKYPVKGINSPVDSEVYEEIMVFFHSDKILADKRHAAKSSKEAATGEETAGKPVQKRSLQISVDDLDSKKESLFSVDIFIGGETFEEIKEREALAVKAAEEIKRKEKEAIAAEKKAEQDRLDEIKEAAEALRKRKPAKKSAGKAGEKQVAEEKAPEVEKFEEAAAVGEKPVTSGKKEVHTEAAPEKEKAEKLKKKAKKDHQAQKDESKDEKDKKSLSDKKRKKRKLSDKGRDIAEKAKEMKKQRPFDEGEEDDGRPKKKRRRKRDKKRKVDEQAVDASIKETLAKMSETQRLKKYKKKAKEDDSLEEEDSSILKVTEFISANELAGLMDVEVNEVIKTCMGLGILISINQRLDFDTIAMIADEFGFTAEQVDEVEIKEFGVEEEEDADQDLKPRPPIVTVMGHVDHGKTSLLDYIRKENVVAGEAGGITQHIGAYVVHRDDKMITFLDTPGHEAFTAMRARGAQLTDIVVLVVAADDNVMPQTIEAIDHSQAAGVPIVIAINKIDKPGADPERIKNQLSNKNILVEDWGGKFGCVEISAKKGLNIDDLLERVLLEAEILEVKANPERNARGVVVETKLEKGRGSVVTVLVQKGTLKIGDVFVCGQYSGRVRAMFNERQNPVKKATPSIPVQVTGFSGLPQAGDEFIVVESEKKAREISIKRQQIKREQQFRQAHLVTLDEISKQIKHGKIEQFNLILKGDVDGSVEALSDSLMELSNEKVKVSIIHKGVGGISESDVLLASASSAVVLGFQVRPTVQARIVAERENIDIRSYSVIYDAVNDVKTVLEGMLPPEIKEEVLGMLEIREVFKISRLGNIAGCHVVSGKINRNDNIRLLRHGTVVYDGKLASLKRFKDDVKEVTSGFECGVSIENFNDLKVSDNIEPYRIVEEKQTL